MPGRSVIHTITPGDHFSPRTGSALPTVVHLLADAAVAAGDAQHAVVLDRTTYVPRYPGVRLIEYDRGPGVTRTGRYLDAAAGRVGLPRRHQSAWFAPLADAVRGEPASHVLAHNAPLMPWLLRGTDHRVSIYAHNQLFRTFSRGEADRIVGEASAVICVSDALADDTRRLLPRALASRVVVVENPVDTIRFVPATQRREGPVRVLFVGRMIPEKGADVLARAAAEFSAEQVEFTFIGSQGFNPAAPLSAYEELLRGIARAHPSAALTFLPFLDRDELPQRYADADILVVPSRWAEPSGLTIAEGMASGLAVVASDVGGIPSVVGDAGVLVPPDDPAVLAVALTHLIEDAQTRAALAKAARLRAEKRDATWAWQRLRGALHAL